MFLCLSGVDGLGRELNALHGHGGGNPRHGHGLLGQPGRIAQVAGVARGEPPHALDEDAHADPGDAVGVHPDRPPVAHSRRADALPRDADVDVLGALRHPGRQGCVGGGGEGELQEVGLDGFARRR